MINTPLDQMYADVLTLGIMFAVPGRVLDLMFLIRRNGYIADTSRSRYTTIGLCTFGLAMACAIVIIPIYQFGIHQGHELLSQVVQPLQFMGWMVYVVCVFCVPYFSFVLMWMWRRRNMDMITALQHKLSR